MAKITAKKYAKEKICLQKITAKKYSKEKICRQKIAMMLSVMGFHDEDPDATAKMMRERLRQIQVRQNKKPSSTSAVVRKITFKFGGNKTSHAVNPSKVSVKASSSEIIAGRVDEKSVEEKGMSGGGNMERRLLSENPNLEDIHGFITRMGGVEAELVSEKRLTKTDCDKNQGRLLIPALQVKNPAGFLEPNEKEKLCMKESMSVEVFDPERRKLTLNLAQWNMKNENYALVTNWKTIVATNGLKENVVIRLYSFRLDRRLCFAVERV